MRPFSLQLLLSALVLWLAPFMLFASAPSPTQYLSFSSGFSVSQTVTADDGHHYRVELSMRNTGSSAQRWTATLRGASVTNLWGGSQTRVDEATSIRADAAVNPGQTAYWGYEADRSSATTTPSGTTPPPAMSLSASSVSFADQPLDALSPPQYLQITNSGGAPLTVTRMALGGANPREFRRGNACITTLAPGASCRMGLRFAPTVAGQRQAALAIHSSLPTRTVALSGLGVASAPPPDSAGYRAVNGQIVDSAGQAVQIRGVNMYGFNADILIPQYLWQMGWKAQIAQVKNLGFNAIRVPFVPDTLYSPKAGYFDPNLNPELVGKTPLQILDLWLAELDRQGLYFVLDFHSVTRLRQYDTWYTDDGSITWNGQPYTEDHWVRDLVFVAKRYAHLSRFMGIDLYNEPTGVVRWGSGDTASYRPEADWKRAVEKSGNAVLAANPKLLLFVEGISANWDGVESNNVPINYGENLRPQTYLPLQLPNAKLVFAPHSYGPDVYMKSTFSDPSFPANLAKDWELLFGQFSPQHPIVMGEFGGRYGNGLGGAKDITWQNAFVDYLISKNIRGGFYWCYTPNSWDTGGILDDNLQVRQDKMALLHRLWGQ